MINKKKDKKGTIIIVSEHINKWGAERSTCSLAFHLKELGYNVLLIIPKKGPILEFLKLYDLEYRVHFFKGWVYYGRKNTIKWFVIKIVNIIQTFILSKKLRLDGIVPDLVYSNTLVHGFGISLARLFHVPHIQHIRENVDVFHMHFYPGYNHVMETIANNSEWIICTCKNIEARYVKDLPPSKLTHVYNGVPICEYKSKSHVNEHFLRMIYVGRLDEDKRPQDIIECIVHLLAKKLCDISLDIYGEGPLENILEDMVQKHGLCDIVKFHGFCSEIDYEKYDVGVMPSTFEAFARTTLEYMMHGLAVVGSDSGGTKEQIEDGVTGYLYRPQDAEDMAKKIEILYTDKNQCSEMGLKGRMRVIQHFSQDRYVNEAAKYFNNTIQKYNKFKH